MSDFVTRAFGRAELAVHEHDRAASDAVGVLLVWSDPTGDAVLRPTVLESLRSARTAVQEERWGDAEEDMALARANLAPPAHGSGG